jgi:hypothetical protein
MFQKRLADVRSRSLCRAAGRMRQGDPLRGLASLGLDPRPIRSGRMDRLTIRAFENGL